MVLSKASGVSVLLGAIRRVAEGDSSQYRPSGSTNWPRIQLPCQARSAELLSKRELESIWKSWAPARTTEQIAAHLFVSVHTVRNHVHSVLQKLDAHSRLEAVSRAQQQGLLDRHLTVPSGERHA